MKVIGSVGAIDFITNEWKNNNGEIIETVGIQKNKRVWNKERRVTELYQLKIQWNPEDTNEILKGITGAYNEWKEGKK